MDEQKKPDFILSFDTREAILKYVAENLIYKMAAPIVEALMKLPVIQEPTPETKSKK